MAQGPERISVEREMELRDMLADARMELDMLRDALGVSVEPHQSLFDRMMDAAKAVGQQEPAAWKYHIKAYADHRPASGIVERKDDLSDAIPKDAVTWAPLYAAPAHPSVRDDWKPIETAPNGAKGYAWMVLAWGDTDDQSTGSGMRCGDKFFAAATFYCLGKAQQYGLRVIEVHPTHWMPQPDVPQCAIQSEVK